MAAAKRALIAVDPNTDGEALEKELCERKLRNYVKRAWALVEPTPFVDGWHVDAICDHLEGVTAGHIQNLAITIPPRFAKSLQASVLWPTWEWGPKNRPSTRWMYLSYSAQLSLRDALKARSLIQRRWYQRKWGDRFKLSDDQNAKGRYNTNYNGFRVSSSVGGLGTGEGGERVVLDDPHNLKTIQSQAARQVVTDWWDTVMPTRLNDPKKSATIIIMQRGHHGDLIGHLKERVGKMFDYLELAAEFEPKRRCTTSIGWTDPRTKEGELLHPERFGKKELASLKTKLGSYAYEAQFQQNPSPAEGGIIKRAWLKYYQKVLNTKFDMVCQSWDMAFKNLDTSSYVVGQVWATKGADVFLLDRIREHLTFTESVKAVENMTAKWPATSWKFIEDKANGTAVIDTLKKKIQGLIAVQTTDSKVGRANAASPTFESGNVYLPHISIAPWVDDYVEQLAQFPMGAYDDDMDATSQAILELRKRSPQLVDNLPPVVSMTQKSSWSGMEAVGMGQGY
jgi:predicted phage terminase large subunit-like protein